MAHSQSTDKVCKFDIYKRRWTEMPNLVDHRANAGTAVIGNYLYAFGGFQTQPYGQVGVRSFERIDLTDP